MSQPGDPHRVVWAIAFVAVVLLMFGFVRDYPSPHDAGGESLEDLTFAERARRKVFHERAAQYAAIRRTNPRQLCAAADLVVGAALAARMMDQYEQWIQVRESDCDRADRSTR